MAINPLDLVFRPDSRAPLELVFGDDAGSGSGGAPEYSLAGGGQITGLRRANAAMVYDYNVERPALAWRHSRMQQGTPASVAARSRWQRSDDLTVAHRSRSDPGLPTTRGFRSQAQQADALTCSARAASEIGVPVVARGHSRFEQTVPLHTAVRSLVQSDRPVIAHVRTAYEAVIRLSRYARGDYQAAVPVLTLTRQSMADGVPLLPARRQGYQAGRLPPGGQQPHVTPPGRDDWCYVPTDPIELAFRPDDRAPLELLFECDRHAVDPEPPTRAPLIVLPARFYMSVRSLHCYLLPSMEEVPIYGVTMTADRGSFGRTFSASAPLDVEPALQPAATVPSSVRIVLDGIEHDFMLSPPEADDAFEDRVLRFSGRSLTAALARPYSRETQRLNTAARNAQQLALEALAFTGVDLDWGLIDWLIPAGAWSHSGTPLQAVQTLVEAAGGYLQSARTGAQLVARHPYPDFNSGAILGLPWNWYQAGVVPDVELAADAVDAVSRVWTVGADIDGVWLSGQAQGISAHYKRTGTAGAKLAQAVTDPLLTHVDALRWRGRSIVAAGGLKQLITLKTPVFSGPSQPGILEVGQLLQVNTSPPWRGRIRSVSVSAEWGGEVTQTVRVERHMEVAA